MLMFSLLFIIVISRPTVWLSGGRRGVTRRAEQLDYRAACLRAAQAARPLQPVLGSLFEQLANLQEAVFKFQLF
jgi:hypothetical protein